MPRRGGSSSPGARFRQALSTGAFDGQRAQRDLGADASNVYAVGDKGTVLRYNGVGWSKLASVPFGTNNLTDIWGTGKSRIYVVGPDTKVYRYGI